MHSINSVTLSGIFQKCVLRYTANGDAVANAELLVVEGKGDQPRKQWLRVVLWRGLATKAAELPKDSKVRITGRLETINWPDKETGKKNYRVQVVADSLDLVSSLQDVPAPKPEPSKLSGTETARAILRPGPNSSAITPKYPITDADLPF